MKSEAEMIISRINAHIVSGGDLYEAVSLHYDFLHKYLPMERMSLCLFCLDKKSIRIIAQASGTGGEKTDFLLSVPEGFLDFFQSNDPPEAYIINEPERDPIGKDIVKRSGFTNWAMIGMPIREKGVAYGAFFFTVTGKNRYSEKHTTLLSGLADAHKTLLDILKKKTL